MTVEFLWARIFWHAAAAAAAVDDHPRKTERLINNIVISNRDRPRFIILLNGRTKESCFSYCARYTAHLEAGFRSHPAVSSWRRVSGYSSSSSTDAVMTMRTRLPAVDLA